MYGGTKSEMERLLKDAEAISGVHYDISNYNDVIEAIHVMQTEMEITGTTAEEASKTISGSLSALGAAWENWLTGLATSDMDMTELTNQLVAAIETALSNVLPAIQRIGASVVSMIAQAFGASDEDIAGAFEGIKAEFDSLLAWAQANVLPTVQAAWELIKTAVQGIATVFQAAWPVISAVIDNLKGYWAGLLAVATEVFNRIGDVINGIVPVISGVFNFISGIGNSIKSVISGTASFAAAQIGGLRSIVGTVQGIFNGVRNAIMTPINAAKNAVRSAINAIKSIINGAHLSLPHFKLPHFNINGGELPWGIGGQGRPPSISVSWYAQGGIVDDATLIGAGERGPELIWPSYDPYISRYAEAITSHMPNDSAQVINWLESNLGPIIEEYAPTATPREFGRMVRSVV